MSEREKNKHLFRLHEGYDEMAFARKLAREQGYREGYHEAIEAARKAQCSACKDGWVLNEQGHHVAPGAGSFTVPCHAQAIRALEPNAIEALTPGERS